MLLWTNFLLSRVRGAVSVCKNYLHLTLCTFVMVISKPWVRLQEGQGEVHFAQRLGAS